MALHARRMFVYPLLACALLAGYGVQPAQAQFFGSPRTEQPREERAPPPPPRRSRTEQRPEPRQERPNFFERLFGTQPRTPAEPPPAPPAQSSRPNRSPPAVSRKVAPGATTAPRSNRATRSDAREPAAPVRKIEPTTFVAVMGDSLAQNLAGGLEDVLADRPHVGLVRQIRPGTGFLKETDRSWKAIADEILARNPPVVAAVVFMGPHDDPPKRGESNSAAGISPWTDLYAVRVDDITLAFRIKGIPLLWVGLPPVEDARASADNAFLNELVQQRVTSLGASFIDVWEGFVNEDENYTAQGPNLDGQVVRLRSADGLHFTSEGERKLAHYVELELRNYLAPKEEGAALADVAKEIETVPITPGSSRILLLGEAPRTPGAVLVPASTAPALPLPPDAQIAARSLRTGEALPAKPGRADDYAWSATGP